MNPKLTQEYILNNPGWFEEWVVEHNAFDQAGQAMVAQCMKFDKLHKRRLQLENYNFIHEGLSPTRKKEWDELEPNYVVERDKARSALQNFINMAKERHCPMPQWIQDCKWLDA